jgi:hypothetical protein
MNKLCIRDPQKVRRQGASRKAWSFHADEPQRCIRIFWGITLRGGEDLDAWCCCRLLMWNNHMALPASSPAPKSSPPNAQLIH